MKLICKLDIDLKVLKSLSRFGIVVSGSVRKRRTLSAKAANLYVWWFISMPLMSGFVIMRLNNGSRVRMKINGGRGHPWPVPFEMGKASDRWPLTRTLTVGLE